MAYDAKAREDRSDDKGARVKIHLAAIADGASISQDGTLSLMFYRQSRRNARARATACVRFCAPSLLRTL
jgi:hypothetical protein